MDTPVLLICFNRPEYVAQMIEALRKCRVSKLFVFKDGPRPDNANDSQASKDIEKQIQGIDWDCEIITNYMQNNLGCGYGPYTAISWAFQYVDELVILEDDCIPTNSFFTFCREMLDKYRDDSKVLLISGFSRLNDTSIFGDNDYIFSQYGVTWGWATWKRVWNDFDMQLRNLDTFFRKGGFKNQFRTKKEADFFNNRYRMCQKDKLLYKHVWDIQFGLHSRVNGALRIVPKYSLIQYIGVDGTHYSVIDNKSDVFDVQSLEDFKVLNSPLLVEANDNYDQMYFTKYVYTEYRLIYRIINKLKRCLKIN